MANPTEENGMDSVLGAMFGGAPAAPAKAPTPAPAKPAPVAQPAQETTESEDVPLNVVKQMFPGTPPKNIEKHYPFIMQAFKEYGMSDARLQLMAFATIRAETASFQPISEGKSQYNTSPGGRPFDLYDNKSSLGNRGAPDGDRFKGRGFVQLTGRANYTTYSQKLGLGTQLVDNPDLGNDPLIAARLLVYFIKDKEKKALAAIEDGDLALARKLVNGGSHGLDAFSQAFETGAKLMGW
jgi:peptidoglycan L-alanyl-D-glutamate endopeptidase CwlK